MRHIFFSFTLHLVLTSQLALLNFPFLCLFPFFFFFFFFSFFFVAFFASLHYSLYFLLPRGEMTRWTKDATISQAEDKASERPNNHVMELGLQDDLDTWRARQTAGTLSNAQQTT